MKLDIDKGMHRPKLHEIMRRLRRSGYKPVWMMETASPGGKGFHVVLALEPEPKTPQEVVAIQAILGSDPDREACNLRRAKIVHRASKYWRERWNGQYQRPRR